MNRLLAGFLLIGGLAGGVSPAVWGEPAPTSFTIDSMILTVPAARASDVVWRTAGEPKNGNPAAADALLQVSEVRIGTLALSFSPEGTLLYNGGPQPPAAAEVEILAQPRITVGAGSTAIVKTGAALHYFEPRKDGAYDLRVVPQEDAPGLEYSVRVRPGDGKKLHLDCQLKLILLEGREKIPDVELEVGRPKVSVHDFKAGLNAVLGEWSFVSSQFLPDKSGRGGDVLLILLRVRQSEAGGTS